MNTQAAAGAQAGSRINAGERIFATIEKGRGEEVRVALSQFKGRTFLAVRIWYTDNSGEKKPSAKGVNIAVDHLPAIADGIAKALEAARADGLV